MRILLTGAHGFVGRYTAQAIATAGHEVVGIGHGAWTSHKEWGVAKWSDVHVSLANLVNSSAGIDAVVNCAGSGNVGFSFQNPLEDFDKNARTLMEILEFVRLHNPKVPVVTLSSAGIYGKADLLPTPETAVPNPVSPYGVHKLVGEELCRSYAKHFGLSIAVVRPFSVYGAGLRKQLLWDASTKVRAGEAAFFGTGEETRDWVHVRDLAQLILNLVLKPVDGFAAINCGSGKSVRNSEVLSLLAKHLGASVTVKFLGPGRAGDPEHYLADISVAKGRGWSSKVSLEEGISEYAKWFLKEGYETK